MTIGHRFGTDGAHPLAVVSADPKKPRQRSKVSPTVRSKKMLEDAGWFVEKVEQRLPIPGRFVTRDLFGFGDLFAVSEHLGVLIVQTTSGDNVSARVRKMEDTQEIRGPLVACLKAGILVHVHGWARRGLRGEKKLWTCRVVEVRLGPNGSLEWQEGGEP